VLSLTTPHFSEAGDIAKHFGDTPRNFEMRNFGFLEEKKRGGAKSGRPSWMNLSEEGSSVSCIVSPSESRSNIF
jgi:hypothetical protein